jgi:hypothetical protein
VVVGATIENKGSAAAPVSFKEVIEERIAERIA